MAIEKLKANVLQDESVYINEHRQEKTYLLTYSTNENSVSLSIHAVYVSTQRLHCPLEETLHLWVAKMRTSKILIRMHGCAC